MAVIATFEPLNDEDRTRLTDAERDTEITVVQRESPVGDEDWLIVRDRDLSTADVSSMGSLKGISLFESGNASLPFAKLAGRGVTVKEVASLSGLGVAEHAIALMLALKKQIVAGHQAVVGNNWRTDITEPMYTNQRDHVFNWSGIENIGWLFGQTLGVVGFGKIGRALAKRAQAFDMDVLYFNRRRLSAAEEKQLGVRYADLNTLASKSDIVSLHVPFNESTENLIGEEQLQLMKSSSLLINGARGRVVNEAALTEALRNRSIAGAGLDVLVYEPPFPDNPILTLDNVVFTPHSAGIWDPISRDEQFRVALRYAVEGLRWSD